jgi:hypothetical protein
VRRSARCALAMENERGKRKGVGVAWWRWSALCRRHGREWGTTRGWLYAEVRAGVGRGAAVAVGRRGVAGSGPAMVRAGGAHARGA